MDDRIDINRADAETLALLPGIGLKRAEKIVEYRTAVHPFEELIELAAVPGISERMVREIADLITVTESATAEMEEATSLVEIDSPVEAVALDELDSGNGAEPAVELPKVESGEAAETAAAETAELEAEPLVDLPEVDVEEEETAEFEAAPVEEFPLSDLEDEEPPVVVTMLDSRPGLSDTAAEPEPTPETESVPETAVRRPAASAPAPEVIERRVVETVQRRHFHFWQQFLGVMTGALIGSLLTLLLLYFFNGTLRFAGESRVQLQLDEETSAIRQSQSLMTDEIGELAGRVAELDNELATSEEAIGAVEEDVSGLEDETAALSEQLETIDLAAEKFDNFLSGLRDLLVAIQGLPPVPTATVTISGTATISATISGTVTPQGTAVTTTPTPTGLAPEGSLPTRTPRPTATPLIETQN